MEATYRWIDGPLATDEDWDAIEGLIASRGWVSLNRNTTRILVAEDATDHRLLGFHVFQFMPFAGPLYLAPTARRSGVAEELADKMLAFLIEGQARGWVVTAESPHAKKLCEDRGMTKVEYPVYVMGDPGGVNI